MSNFSCREVCSRWTSHLHIPFLLQYDYLGDRRPVPAGLFPYNYPPSPTVHDKMVRPTPYALPRPPELASLLGPSTPGTPMLTVSGSLWFSSPCRTPAPTQNWGLFSPVLESGSMEGLRISCPQPASVPSCRRTWTGAALGWEGNQVRAPHRLLTGLPTVSSVLATTSALSLCWRKEDFSDL